MNARQHGFTYLTALLLIAVVSTGAVSIVETWSHARQREKEAELRWIGEQFKQAIGLYYQRSPGAVRRYPEKLEDLIEDRRFVNVQRYLRRIHVDPMTGKAEWGIVASPEGGIIGVHSLSRARPIREIGDTTRYEDWKFIYAPPEYRQSIEQVVRKR